MLVVLGNRTLLCDESTQEESRGHVHTAVACPPSCAGSPDRRRGAGPGRRSGHPDASLRQARLPLCRRPTARPVCLFPAVSAGTRPPQVRARRADRPGPALPAATRGDRRRLGRDLGDQRTWSGATCGDTRRSTPPWARSRRSTPSCWPGGSWHRHGYRRACRPCADRSGGGAGQHGDRGASRCQ